MWIHNTYCCFGTNVNLKSFDWSMIEPHYYVMRICIINLNRVIWLFRQKKNPPIRERYIHRRFRTTKFWHEFVHSIKLLSLLKKNWRQILVIGWKVSYVVQLEEWYLNVWWNIMIINCHSSTSVMWWSSPHTGNTQWCIDDLISGTSDVHHLLRLIIRSKCMPIVLLWISRTWLYVKNAYFCFICFWKDFACI